MENLVCINCKCVLENSDAIIKHNGHPFVKYSEFEVKKSELTIVIEKLNNLKNTLSHSINDTNILFMNIENIKTYICNIEKEIQAINIETNSDLKYPSYKCPKLEIKTIKPEYFFSRCDHHTILCGSNDRCELESMGNNLSEFKENKWMRRNIIGSFSLQSENEIIENCYDKLVKKLNGNFIIQNIESFFNMQPIYKKNIKYYPDCIHSCLINSNLYFSVLHHSNDSVFTDICIRKQFVDSSLKKQSIIGFFLNENKTGSGIEMTPILFKITEIKNNLPFILDMKYDGEFIYLLMEGSICYIFDIDMLNYNLEFIKQIKLPKHTISIYPINKNYILCLTSTQLFLIDIGDSQIKILKQYTKFDNLVKLIKWDDKIIILKSIKYPIFNPNGTTKFDINFSNIESISITF